MNGSTLIPKTNSNNSLNKSQLEIPQDNINVNGEIPNVHKRNPAGILTLLQRCC